MSRLAHWWSRWWRPAGRPQAAPARADDSGYFATQFVEAQNETRLLVHWSQRGPEVGAQPIDPHQGCHALARVMAQDRSMAALGLDWLQVIAGYFDYVQVEAGKRLLGQDEQGDFLLVILDGAVAEERQPPVGPRVRLGELRQGELLGELSMMDGGTRLCSCVALGAVSVAVLPAVSLARLQAEEPKLAAALAVWIGKRLSLRLRQVSARLSVLLARTEPAEPPSTPPLENAHHGTRPGIQVRQ